MNLLDIVLKNSVSDDKNQMIDVAGRTVCNLFRFYAEITYVCQMCQQKKFKNIIILY